MRDAQRVPLLEPHGEEPVHGGEHRATASAGNPAAASSRTALHVFNQCAGKIGSPIPWSTMAAIARSWNAVSSVTTHRESPSAPRGSGRDSRCCGPRTSRVAVGLAARVGIASHCCRSAWPKVSAWLKSSHPTLSATPLSVRSACRSRSATDVARRFHQREVDIERRISGGATRRVQHVADRSAFERIGIGQRGPSVRSRRPGGERIGIAAKIRQQVLARRVDQRAQPCLQQRRLHGGSQPLDQPPHVHEVNQRMAEIVVMRERCARRARVRGRRMQSLRQRTVDQRDGGVLVLRLDRRGEVPAFHVVRRR